MIDCAEQRSSRPAADASDAGGEAASAAGTTPGLGSDDPWLGIGPGEDEAVESADSDAVTSQAGLRIKGGDLVGLIFRAVILIILFFFFAIVVAQPAGAGIW